MKNYSHLLRSFVVTGAAVTMAFAQQSSGAKSTAASGTSNSTSTAASSTATSGSNGTSGESMVGGMDQKFLTEAANGGIAEVQMAQMAQQKASSQEVKDYARRLEQDHTKANNELKEVAQRRQVSLPTDTDAKHKEMATKLNALSGAEFDRAYMRMMVQDHRKDIKMFERESNTGMDTDLKNFASSTLPTLKEHLQQAEQINGSTRSRKADKSSGHQDASTSSNSSSSSSSSTTSPASK